MDIDAPPVLVERTIICPTVGCINEGAAITLACAGIVVCGACGTQIEGES